MLDGQMLIWAIALAPLSRLLLQYPYLTSIIPNGLLIFLSIIMPLIIFALVFIARRKQTGAFTELRLCLLAFAFCVLLNSAATTFAKKYVGRPRPNFVAATGYAWVNGTATYSNPSHVDDSFQSFPSGHSSTSFSGLGFLAFWAYHTLYCYWRLGATDSASAAVLSSVDGARVTEVEAFHTRATKERAYATSDNHLPLLAACTLPLWLALYIAVSRVRDFVSERTRARSGQARRRQHARLRSSLCSSHSSYACRVPLLQHHNYEDILAGMCLGLSIAYFVYRTVYLARQREWIHVNEEAFQSYLVAEHGGTAAAQTGEYSGVQLGEVHAHNVRLQAPPPPLSHNEEKEDLERHHSAHAQAFHSLREQHDQQEYGEEV